MDSSIIERRDAAGRLLAQWWPLQWTTPLGDGQPHPISLFDLAELRATVDVDRLAAGLDPVRWVGRSDNDPTFVAGVTRIRAVHFTQLRAAIAELWDTGGLGALPEFRAGPIVPASRRISVRDPLDLRAWLEAYERARPDLSARVAWRYDGVSAFWPPAATDAGAKLTEMWDAAGQSVFRPGLAADRATELRRVDSRWYRTDLFGGKTAGLARIVCVSPDAASLTDLLPVSLTGPPIEGDHSLRHLTWDVPTLDLDGAGRPERDALGRVVRIVEGDTVVARLAYDGLGRVRKLAGASATWHVVGPDLAVPALAPEPAPSSMS